ncbi:MAG: hypothetical protein ABW061_20210 [Polyangiaceae bacterium]
MSGRIWAVTAFCSVFALLHCGGTVEIAPGGDAGAPSAGSAGRGHGGRSNAHAGSGGSPAATAGTGAQPTDAGFDVYVDPGCPDVGAPVRVDACDAFSATSGCDPGLGCYPFIQYPFGDACGAQKFGTECRPAGTGQQGDACGTADASCASGYVCVVGAQPGKHCVQLCPVGAVNACPSGLICGDLDVEGFGVCS